MCPEGLQLLHALDTFPFDRLNRIEGIVRSTDNVRELGQCMNCPRRWRRALLAGTQGNRQLGLIVVDVHPNPAKPSFFDQPQQVGRHAQFPSGNVHQYGARASRLQALKIKETAILSRQVHRAYDHISPLDRFFSQDILHGRMPLDHIDANDTHPQPFPNADHFAANIAHPEYGELPSLNLPPSKPVAMERPKLGNLGRQPPQQGTPQQHCLFGNGTGTVQREVATRRARASRRTVSSHVVVPCAASQDAGHFPGPDFRYDGLRPDADYIRGRKRCPVLLDRQRRKLGGNVVGKVFPELLRFFLERFVEHYMGAGVHQIWSFLFGVLVVIEVQDSVLENGREIGTASLLNPHRAIIPHDRPLTRPCLLNRSPYRRPFGVSPMPTIISWNVNGIRAATRHGFLDWLADAQPDILCVQETKAHKEQLGEDTLAPPGYGSIWTSAERKGYSGVAAYVKAAPQGVEVLGDDTFDVEGRVQILHYATFSVVNAYFPNSQAEGARIDYKLAFCAALLKRCDGLRAEGRNVVICGDYNIAHKPIDLKNPRTNEKNPGYLPGERAWMETFVEAGYVDTFRMFNQEPGQYTWWSYRFKAREKNVGWRIDYHCVNEEMSDRVQEASILSDVMGSDHCPVLLRFKD